MADSDKGQREKVSEVRQTGRGRIEENDQVILLVRKKI